MLQRRLANTVVAASGVAIACIVMLSTDEEPGSNERESRWHQPGRSVEPDLESVAGDTVEREGVRDVPSGIEAEDDERIAQICSYLEKGIRTNGRPDPENQFLMDTVWSWIGSHVRSLKLTQGEIVGVIERLA